MLKNAKIKRFKLVILSGQKLIKNAQNGTFWRLFEKPEAGDQTVLPDRSILIGQKFMKMPK